MFATYAVRGKEQALQVGELGSRQSKQTGIPVCNSAGCRLVPSEGVAGDQNESRSGI